VAKASAQRKPAAEGRGRKPARPQLALFEEDAGKVVKLRAPAAEPTSPPAVAPPPSPPAAAGAAKPASRRVTAESLAKQQREISVSEFFVKNRHLLGFDNPSKALLTTIK